MPEARYRKGCGPGCVRCWRNNLKHGSPEAKAWLKKNKLDMDFTVSIRHESEMKDDSVSETPILDQTNDKYEAIPIVNNTGDKGQTGRFSMRKRREKVEISNTCEDL